MTRTLPGTSGFGRGPDQSDELDAAVGVDVPVGDAFDVDVDVVDSPDEEPDDDESLADVVEAGEAADFFPRLSVLKKPEPLNVTPTGVKTFLTGRTSPVSGWAISVRLSSWKPCWTSMVSPVSTNL